MRRRSIPSTEPEAITSCARRFVARLPAVRIELWRWRAQSRTRHTIQQDRCAGCMHCVREADARMCLVQAAHHGPTPDLLVPSCHLRHSACSNPTPPVFDAPPVPAPRQPDARASCTARPHESAPQPLRGKLVSRRDGVTLTGETPALPASCHPAAGSPCLTDRSSRLSRVQRRGAPSQVDVPTSPCTQGPRMEHRSDHVANTIIAAKVIKPLNKFVHHILPL